MTSRWALILVAAAVFGAHAKRSITEKDVYDFQWSANPQISPNGSGVVYTPVKISAKHDSYETSLWIVPATGGPARPLAIGPHDSSPRSNWA